jgi:quercetin dioxygenase-like cupin family protein
MSHELLLPRALWSLGCLFVLKGATPDFELIEASAPAGYSPPLHQHDSGTESFYVLEGDVRFVVGDTDVTHGPGGFVHVPRATPHSFRVLEGGPARMLLIAAPATQWDFFTEAGEPAPAERLPDAVEIPANLPELVARHGGAVLGPPLT